MSSVRFYSKEGQSLAVNILLLAFSGDPFQRYLMPDLAIYQQFKINRKISV